MSPDPHNGRSASAAFGNDSDHSIESPVRKKQNTSTTIPAKPAPEKDNNIARTTIENNIRTSTNGHSRVLGVEHVNGATNVGHDDSPSSSIEEKNENVLDIAPPSSTGPTKPDAGARTPNITVAEETVRVETTLPTPQKTQCDNTIATKADDDPSKIVDPGNGSGRSWIGSLGWFGFFVFVNLFVLSGVIWTGILLNERITYQLESLECRERLQQTYQAIGLSVDLEDLGDDDEENEISERFEEQRYYWQELEAQVRHWKKEAKKYQRYSDAYKDQCQTDLLLCQVDPCRGDNQQRES